jgi:hypothetical protein
MGKSLAVQVDIGFVKATHELAIGNVVQAASGVDADDPQLAECSFLLFAMGKSKSHTTLNCLACSTIAGTAMTKKSSGFQQVFLLSTMCCYIICCSWHFSSPLQAQHDPDSAFIDFADDGTVAQIAFQFGCLFGFDMCAFCMMAFDLTCSRHLEALGGGTACFDLWHLYLLSLV